MTSKARQMKSAGYNSSTKVSYKLNMFLWSSINIEKSKYINKVEGTYNLVLVKLNKVEIWPQLHYLHVAEPNNARLNQEWQEVLQLRQDYNDSDPDKDDPQHFQEKARQEFKNIHEKSNKTFFERRRKGKKNYKKLWERPWRESRFFWLSVIYLGMKIII